MGKTQALRGAIMAQLNRTPGATYHKRAPKDAKFPYKVYELQRAELGDLSRDDISLVIDIWDRAVDSKAVEDIADQLESNLRAVNIPGETVFPTFFRDGRFPIEDEDKDIQRIQLTFLVQLYEGGTI